MSLNRNYHELTGVYIYDEARTVHLNRIETTKKRGLIFRKFSYDFHPEFENPEKIFHLSTISTIIFIIRNRLSIIEINEPLLLRAIPRIFLYIYTIRIMDKIRHHKTTIVSYCIENADISIKVSRNTLKSFLLKILFFISRFLISQYDRLAFGTEGALKEYKSMYKDKIIENLILIPPIEPRCNICTLNKRRNRVLFVGAFDHRKGVMDLIKAWSMVSKPNKYAELLLLGKGPLISKIAEAIRYDDSIKIEIDPSRQTIHAALSDANILVLLSKTSENWREQVGLPILEGLSHGCKIVTTDSTGISDWLKKQGHYVISEPVSEKAVSQAIISALDAPLNPENILDTIPKESGRSEADNWLWATGF